jgi:hypothetical protein
MVNFKRGLTVVGLICGLGGSVTGLSASDLKTVATTPIPSVPGVLASPTLSLKPPLPGSITLVPNPLGNEITFRALVVAPSSLKISIYDHFYAPVTVLAAKGNGCFDVLWKLKKVQDGIYYFESQIKDVKSGVISKLPVQKVIVTR